MDLEKLVTNLERKGYEVHVFDDRFGVRDYLKDSFHNTTIGFGDSITVKKTGFYEAVEADNELHDPNRSSTYDEFLDIAKKAFTCEYFFTGVNAVSEDGVFVNIDGTGNRIGGSCFGHKKVYYVFGTNKICNTLDDAIFRARNVAAPLNCRRLKLKTPCTVGEMKCHDCKSPDRICNGMLLQLDKMDDVECEVLIIKEDLGQ